MTPSTEQIRDSAIEIVQAFEPNPKINVLDMLHENGQHQYRIRLLRNDVSKEVCVMARSPVLALRLFNASVKKHFRKQE